jgi:hypothetical protein
MIKAEELGDISSPTVKTESVLFLFGLAARRGWKVSNRDVAAAYLNTRLPADERVPMRLGPEEVEVLLKEKPEWAPFVRRDGSMIVMLEGGLYGLPQASKLWYDKFSKSLLKLGHVKSVMDECIFIKYEKSGAISVIAVHVDD